MNVFSRDDWGALPPRNVTRLDPAKVTKFIVHHTTGNHETRNDSVSWVRAIQRTHINDRKWSDIAYNFLVDKYGYIYVGRGWDTSGAHTAGHNSTSIGVAFLGDGSRPVPEEAKRAIAHLYAQCRGLFGPVTPSTHQNWSATACPGAQLATWVRAGLPVRAPAGAPLVVTQSTVSVQRAQLWAESRGATLTFVHEIIPAIYKAANNQAFVNSNRHIDPIIAVAQSAKETGWGRFGGVLTESWRNTAGIKVAAGGGNYDPDAHERFPSWEEGARAQLNHLAAYTGLSPFGIPHGRYHTVLRTAWAGTIRTIEELGGRWAPSLSYGTDIVRMVEEARAHNAPAPAPVAPAPVARPTIRRGSSGDAVRELQTKLFVDGVFGPNTEDAVRRFQHSHGLTVDGIVGPQTWDKLDEVE
jgi:hypothetical protein